MVVNNYFSKLNIARYIYPPAPIPLKEHEAEGKSTCT